MFDINIVCHGCRAVDAVGRLWQGILTPLHRSRCSCGDGREFVHLEAIYEVESTDVGNWVLVGMRMEERMMDSA